MEVAYLHLVTNHIPIIGVPFAAIILAIGVWRKSEIIQSLALFTFAALAIVTVGVFLLGKGGEDFVEDLAGVSHDAIEEHEGAAAFGLISVGVLGLAALYTLIRSGGLKLLLSRDDSVQASFPRVPVLIILVLALLSSAILGYVGKLGGKIRHSEFHGNAAATNEETDAETGDENGGKGRRRNRGGR